MLILKVASQDVPIPLKVHIRNQNMILQQIVQTCNSKMSLL